MNGPDKKSLALKETGDQIASVSPALNMVFEEQEEAAIRAICKDASSGALTSERAVLHCMKMVAIRDLKKRVANAIGRGRIGAADIAADLERN